MWWKMLWASIFGRKKLYKVVYKQLSYTYATIIEARDECKAIRKFHKMMEYEITPSIISIEEYWVQ